jgi:hypothetical protein
MKNLLLMLLFTIYSFAGAWTTLGGLSTKEVEPSAVYSLDTIGQNPRVYEFSPKGNEHFVCIIVYTEGEHKSPVMQCIPKADKRK